MTKPINSYADLLEEKGRLKLLMAAQREVIRADINEIKEELAPVRTAISVIGKVTTKDSSNWLLTTAADKTIDLVVKNLILSKAGWITKLVLPFIMKNFSSHIIADNKDRIVSKLFSWIGKKKGKDKKRASKAVNENLYEEQED